MKLQLKPLTNTKAISINFLPDTNIGQDVLRFVKVWRTHSAAPRHNRCLRMCCHSRMPPAPGAHMISCAAA